MKILILGGDGFCGWPTALHLSAQGHAITIVDNLSRRRIDEELGTQSLTPIALLTQRCQTWREISGCEITVHQLDVADDFAQFVQLILALQPDAIVHLAEQRAAPYSMKTATHKRYTINNNVNATHNVLAAIVESGLDIHLVHLGTMGVYGYGTAGESLPEGYLKLADREIRYPSNPGSIYHMSKCLDAEMFAFYAKNDGVRITDLHQGIIWGTNTAETNRHPDLINRFDYDGDYGTVLNRFIVQSAIGYPLTVHGTGGQTRAFIHIQNSVQCIRLALENPPAPGDRVKIFNQMTETHRVRDLAEYVSSMTGTEVEYVDNPRKESAENELDVQNDQFIRLGLIPILLSDGLVEEVLDVVAHHIERIDRNHIPCTSRWSRK
jgi:UDP-sulfoquinovose synthase